MVETQSLAAIILFMYGKSMNLHPLSDPVHWRGCVLAIGNFDGVHKGHQALLQKAKHMADEAGIPLVVLTFEPHPRTVLFANKSFHRLTTAEEKKMRLKKYGTNHVCIVDFTKEFSYTSPEDFLDMVAHDFKAHYVVVGEDFRFGKTATGNVCMMQRDTRFETFVMPLVVDEKGKEYSSRRLRKNS